MNIAQVAAAFAAGKSAKCHNASTDGIGYYLHGHKIASRGPAPGGVVAFDWCDWYTKTTASHMNAILRAIGATHRVSYAAARDSGEGEFYVVAA